MLETLEVVVTNEDFKNSSGYSHCLSKVSMSGSLSDLEVATPIGGVCPLAGALRRLFPERKFSVGGRILKEKVDGTWKAQYLIPDEWDPDLVDKAMENTEKGIFVRDVHLLLSK